MADVLWAFSLAKTVKGHPFHVSDESEEKTYSAQMKQDGGFSDVRLFAEQGGASVVQGLEGDVYLAAGNILVYDPSFQLGACP